MNRTSTGSNVRIGRGAGKKGCDLRSQAAWVLLVVAGGGERLEGPPDGGGPRFPMVALAAVPWMIVRLKRGGGTKISIGNRHPLPATP